MIYGPYGGTAGIPELIAGVESDADLRVEDFLEDAVTGAWRPRMTPGRYYVSSEASARYRYARAGSTTVNIAQGEQTLTVSADVTGPLTLKAPVLIAGLTQVAQTVRFAQPVPSGNAVSAGSFVAPAYLQDPDTPSETSAIYATDQLWWMPLFGGTVLAVHKSRRPRSIDVLADADARLYPVETPDQLADDRCYCADYDTGIVYGKVSASFPPAPFGSGQPPATYVTVAYPLESDPDLGRVTAASGWGSYFSANSAFYAAYEGDTSQRYYNPIRLEEICAVDTDGLVRVRRGPVSTATGHRPSAVLIGPSGPVLCTTNQVSDSSFNVLLPDPTQGNALSPLPYGTTVVARYYVDDTYAVVGADSGALRIRAFSSVARSGSAVQYEGDPGGLALPVLEDASSPDLNPLTSQVASGFLWYADAGNVLPVPVAVSAALGVGNPRPVYDPTSSIGEVFTVRASLIDPTGSPISGADLHLWCNPSAPVTVEASDLTSGADGSALFRLRLTSDNSGQPFEVYVSDGRSPSAALAQTSVLPVSLEFTWEPSVALSLCEDYRTVGSGRDGLTKQTVRVSAVTPDGFPWTGAGNSLAVRSSRSSFYAPHSQADANLGAQVTLSCDSLSDIIGAGCVMTVGYAPVKGDTLTAYFYMGDSRYSSAPLVVT